MMGCMVCLRRETLFTRIRAVAGSLCCFLLCQRCLRQDDQTILSRVRERQAETNRLRGMVVTA